MKYKNKNKFSGWESAGCLPVGQPGAWAQQQVAGTIVLKLVLVGRECVQLME